MRNIVIAYGATSGALVALFVTMLSLAIALPVLVLGGVVFATVARRLVARLQGVFAKAFSIVALVSPLIVVSWLAGNTTVGGVIAVLVIITVYVQMPGDTAVEAHARDHAPLGANVQQLVATVSDISENWRDLLTAITVIVVALFIAVATYLGVELRLDSAITDRSGHRVGFVDPSP